MEISIIAPVYKEEGNIKEFLNRIRPILETVTKNFEIIFSLDPSPDRTEEVILEERKKDARIKLLKFSRRFGQPSATLAALQYSTGNAAIVIDVDLQDPPEMILKMIELWKTGYEVVYAQRKNRTGETLLKKIVAYMGYKVIDKLAEVKIPRNTGDFRLMSRRVVDEILKLNESHGFLRGMVALVGFSQVAILFDRPARFAGTGNYNRFLGSIKIGLNGIFCFSNRPLFLSFILGFFLVLTSLILGITSLITEKFGLSALVLFVGGVQLFSVGILGEYIGRIYDEVKRRPRFILEKAEGFSSDQMHTKLDRIK